MTALLPWALLLALAPPPVSPNLRLEELVAAASAHFPRRQEEVLRGEISDRRLANLDARFRPSLDLQGNAAYHSEVPSIPGGLFAGPARDQYSLVVGADQRLWDAGRTDAEKRIEEAAREADRQQVEVDFHGLRERLEGAFFAALGTQAELDLLATLESDLSAQLQRVEARVSAGAALPGDAAVLAATREEERQRVLQVAGERRAAFAVLQALTGLPLDEGAPLATPEPEAPADLMAAARNAAQGAGVGRPELEALARGRLLLERQRALTGLARRPVVSAFAQGGLGRPADQNFFERDLTPFAVVGVRLRWQPFDWGQSQRESEIRGLEAEVSQARERAFLETLSASLQGLARRIEALREILAADDRVVELRQVARRKVEAQLREGVITPTDYLLERNAEHRARLTREQHRLELARNTVDFLTTLGASR